jgi:hypothetical protein
MRAGGLVGLIWILFLVLIQLVFFAGLVFLWMRMKRNMDDDSRWSRGLQFVQSKIAVFEDLSDRTEYQVKQLTIMMENKICDLQRKIDEADEVLTKISKSMKKSIEVAQIFQDKIPHEEIIERQNTVKFVKAALMAHEGKSVNEICEVVDLPKSQVQFISKVNADRLSFDSSQIPEWLKSELNKDPLTKHNLFEKKRLGKMSDGLSPRSPMRPLDQVLKQHSGELDFEEGPPLANIEPKPVVEHTVAEYSNKQITVVNSQAVAMAQGALGKKAKELGIRPVVFPRIEMPR